MNHPCTQQVVFTILTMYICCAFVGGSGIWHGFGLCREIFFKELLCLCVDGILSFCLP